MFLKVLLTGVAVAALGLAQMGGGGGGGMGSGSGSGAGGMGSMGGGAGREMDGAPGGQVRAQRQTKADLMVSRLKLNKDQTSEFITILESTQKDATSVIQEVMQNRNVLANAMLAGKSDAEMEPLSRAVKDSEFQMMGVEVKAFRKIVGILKPNQVAKAPEAFELMADIFLPQAGPGGGGGRGGMGRNGGGR
jgi:hypothetical protein